MRTFYLHFSQLAMKRGDPKVWSVITSKECLHAQEVICHVPLTTVYKPGNKNPRAFLKGKAEGWWLDGKVGGTLLLSRYPTEVQAMIEAGVCFK